MPKAIQMGDGAREELGVKIEWLETAQKSRQSDGPLCAGRAEMIIEIDRVSKILEHVLGEFVESLTRDVVVITTKETSYRTLHM